jgi:vancomycin resistance protein YoaR
MYHSMTKTNAATPSRKRTTVQVLTGIGIGLFFVAVAAVGIFFTFEEQYKNKVYPNVTIDGTHFGGKTKDEVQAYWLSQNIPFEQAAFEFRFENEVATISGSSLELGYDATLSATQAFAIGRSNNVLRDTLTKFFQGEIKLSPYFRWKTDIVDSVLSNMSGHIFIPVQEALFQFENGRVTAFRPSHDGRQLNRELALKRLDDAIKALPHAPIYHIVIDLPVDTVKPTVSTENVNTFGIKELIGQGYSEYKGSIAGRVHNVALAASRINGVLIPPGETFSFNNALGDISAATGYQSAYIIKDGRTVLGDGGGVCQVSTTLFRAALNAGLPIVERHSHAYRVKYYELGGYKAGLDATVFSPSVDFKIKNDTPAHILIQAKANTKNMTLLFELYGTGDGRNAQIIDHMVGGISAPPPPLYQDDPTLPAGVVKQVDWEAWGARASFGYKVTRGDEVLQDTKFVSNFRPWQSVFLKGVATQ